MMNFFLSLLVLSTFIFAPLGLRAAPRIGIDISPHYGSGSMAGGFTLSRSSGLTLGTDLLFPLASWAAIGPRIEYLEMAHHGATTTGALAKTLLIYKHHIAALGATSRFKLSNAPDSAAIVMNLSVGLGKSRARMRSSTPSSYASAEFNGIRGRHQSLDLALRVPIKPRLAVTVGALAATYLADQSGATGTMEFQQAVANGYSLGATTLDPSVLPPETRLNTLAFKLGIALDL